MILFRTLLSELVVEMVVQRDAASCFVERSACPVFGSSPDIVK